MFHSGTSALIAAWSALPDAGRIPARAAFDPMTLGGLIPHLWTAERLDGDRIPLRLAGGWVERLHGRALAGCDWLHLWRTDSRRMVAVAVAQAFREARPMVLMADSPFMTGQLEIAVAPLRSGAGVANRVVGLYQPLDATDRTAESVGELVARLSIEAGPSLRAPLSLAAVDGRRIA